MEKSDRLSHYSTAILDAEYYEPETNVNIPHEFAVEAAKQWIEDNEK